MNLFKDGFLRKSHQTVKKIIELIKPLIIIKANVNDIRERFVIAFQKITEN